MPLLYWPCQLGHRYDPLFSLKSNLSVWGICSRRRKCPSQSAEIMQILSPLLIIWKKSFDTGKIPPGLLEAVICPLHKGGSRSVPKNFRPVALTSHIIKVFERVIRRALVRYLEENGYMAPGQHGFRALRSTLTQLLSHFDSVLLDLENGACSDTIYLDFSKALTR